jgi:hypothetical protein
MALFYRMLPVCYIRDVRKPFAGNPQAKACSLSAKLIASLFSLVSPPASRSDLVLASLMSAQPARRVPSEEVDRKSPCSRRSLTEREI